MGPCYLCLVQTRSLFCQWWENGTCSWYLEHSVQFFCKGLMFIIFNCSLQMFLLSFLFLLIFPITKYFLHEFQICVICKQIHGSCMQCCKCSTYYHAMCASRAGYCMEVLFTVLALNVFLNHVTDGTIPLNLDMSKFQCWWLPYLPLYSLLFLNLFCGR